MKKRWTASILALLLALSLLPSCGVESSPTVSGGQGQPTQSDSVLSGLPDDRVLTESGDTDSEETAGVTADDGAQQGEPGDQVSQIAGASGGQLSTGTITFSLSDVPAYSWTAYVAVNGNVPYFTASDLTTSSFEEYSSLDALGRCGVAYACVGRDIMPTEERGSIGQVKPTGWHTVKYDCVDGKYLYNRCHLLGYQLTGENANEENLITGTRYLNIEGMLPFENMVADYVQETDNHVLYRVTPIFEGSDLLASGVLMEGYSVEDSGEDICFCIYAYNVQPGVVIDYATGESALADGGTAAEEDTTVTPSQQGEDPVASSSGAAQADYVLNTNTMKFHLPSCSSADNIKASNRQDYHGSRDDLIAQGYEPCKRCNP